MQFFLFNLKPVLLSIIVVPTDGLLFGRLIIRWILLLFLMRHTPCRVLHATKQSIDISFCIV
jgi:hypothetical protein